MLFVRGPRTARSLNLDPKLAIGDAALLVRTLVDFRARRAPTRVGYMPHWESLERGSWAEVCELAGLTLIDPRGPVERVIEQLLECRCLVAEAMHGAIVADALRIPWIAVTPIAPKHRDKWFDWAEALNIDLRPHCLTPSSVDEVVATLKHHKVLRVFAQALRCGLWAGTVNRYLKRKGVERLTAVAANRPCLSTDIAVESATAAMMAKLKTWRAGLNCQPRCKAIRSCWCLIGALSPTILPLQSLDVLFKVGVY